MEDDLNELPEIDSETDNLAVTDKEDVDESIPIYLKKEKKHKYTRKKRTLILISSTHLKKRNKVNTIKWRPIYEVIEEAYLKKSEEFPEDFMKQCKDNEKEAQFIPLDVKNNIK